MSPDKPALERPRYRRISTRLWGDEKFRKLSAPKPNAQTLWFFLLTGPHTQAVPGLFSAGEAMLAEMLGWPRRGFRQAWTELEQRQMVKADWSARVVFVPKAVQHNAPESPNVVKSWRQTIADLPECLLKSEALTSLGAHCEQLGPSFAEAFNAISGLKPSVQSRKPSRKASRKPSPNQDQEQEQEQEQIARFARFWEAFPRKEGQPAAWAQWKLIQPNEDFTSTIVAAAERFAQMEACQRALASGDLSFIPTPKNWLADGRWDAGGDSSAPAPVRGCTHTPRCTGDPVACTDRKRLEMRQPTEAKPASSFLKTRTA